MQFVTHTYAVRDSHREFTTLCIIQKLYEYEYKNEYEYAVRIHTVMQFVTHMYVRMCVTDVSMSMHAVRDLHTEFRTLYVSRELYEHQSRTRHLGSDRHFDSNSTTSDNEL